MLVELSGEVEQAGLHGLPAGTTAREALEVAGADLAVSDDPFLDLPLREGYRVELLADGSVRIWLAQERLLVGLPVDPNAADAVLLEQLPGIGPSKAAAIIEDRSTHGPFLTVDELDRVPGIGPATLARLRPYLGIDGLPEPGVLEGRSDRARDEIVVELPLDLNSAEPSQLEALPGLDAELAAAIVADRLSRGAFPAPSALARVPGVSDAIAEGLAPFVTVAGSEEESP